MIQDQRHRTRRLVLEAIRQSGPIARIDIAHLIGASQATVTQTTAELIAAGLVQEEVGDTAPTKRGRPRVALSLRGDARTLAGFKIAHDSLSAVLMDFSGRLICDHSTPLSSAVLSEDALAQEVEQALDAVLAKGGMARNAVSGIGIGMAGIVDASRGHVYWSPSLDRRNVDFQDTLIKRIGLPVFLDNDANLVALAEQLFGHGAGVSDFLVVTVEAGVGMGIVLGGEVYRGTRGCGAEFGHTKVQLDGALCRCGQRGCLEAYVADYALLREAGYAIPLGAGRTEPNIADVLAAARDGHAAARSIVEKAGRIFSMGLANLVNIFDPELIILSGERMQLDHLYADDVINGIQSQIVQAGMHPPRVVIHKWGNLMWAHGAAAYAIRQTTEIALRSLGGTE